MHFRYDFHEQLDLSKFRKSAQFYLSTQPAIKYDFYLKDFRLGAYVQQMANHQHKLELVIERKINIILPTEIKVSYTPIIPSQDARFQEAKIFQKFPKDFATLEEISNSVLEIIKIITDFVNFIHKVNQVKAFA